VSPTSEARLSTPRRWARFVRERFPPHLHLPVIALIVTANGLIGARMLAAPVGALRLVAAFLVAVLFFFRLRCFDEIKDYKVDLKLNPARPLARGLLTVRQTKRMFLLLTVVELAVAAVFGRAALCAHALAVAYSYLMYREFFVGRFLRPHLTTYAVTHTFVSVLAALSVVTLATGVPASDFPAALFGFALVNWALFNVFEFARKTFAAAEETPGADSYSRRFGPRGAALLCSSQIAGAILLLALLPAGVLRLPSGWPPAWTLHAGLGLLPLATGLRYGWKTDARAAAQYRVACGLYQLSFYALLTWQGA
jgi:4-hydroxybenzoate polyprenyltransferase